MFAYAGGLLLTAATPAHHVTAAHSLLGGHAFWLGLAIGLGASVIPIIPWWIRMAGLVVAVLAAGVVHLTNSHGHGHLSPGHGHLSPAVTPWVVVALLGLGVGLYYGRARGLRHLGQAEFRNRSGSIRNISRF